MKYNNITFNKGDQLLDLLEKVGLEFNQQSGGLYYSIDGATLLRDGYSDRYIIHQEKNTDITFLNGSAFMKSLNETEKSMNMKLFAN